MTADVGPTTRLASRRPAAVRTTTQPSVSLQRLPGLLSVGERLAEAQRARCAHARAAEDMALVARSFRWLQRVLLDPGVQRAIAAAVGGASTSWRRSFRVPSGTGLTFADVVGLDEAKEALAARLIYPQERPDLAETYRIPPGGGVLLYGPPACGKTRLVAALAGELPDVPLLSARASDLKGSLVGETETHVAALFAEARSYERAIVFIDEIDAICPKRGTRAADTMVGAVSELLTQLGGLGGRAPGLLFVAATNRPWDVDPALFNSERVDSSILVPPPDTMARRQLLEMSLAGVPLAADLDFEQVAAKTKGYSGGDVVALCRKAREKAFLEARQTGIAREIGQVDVLEAIENMPSTLRANMLRELREFQRSGIV